MTRRREQETAVDARDDVVEGEVIAAAAGRPMTDEETIQAGAEAPLDAGLADAEMAASVAAHDAADPGYMEDEQAKQDNWAERTPQPDEQSIPPLVETIETLLFHPHIAPPLKVLLMSLVWIGQPMTAVQLGAGSGLTKTQVFHALKGLVAQGIVTESMVPTKTPPWQFHRHYEIKAADRGRFGEITSPTKAAAADDADA
jgi:hypothetical protein